MDKNKFKELIAKAEGGKIRILYDEDGEFEIEVDKVIHISDDTISVGFEKTGENEEKESDEYSIYFDHIIEATAIKPQT